MPAFSDKFPWPSHYGHFDFFEERMGEHSEIASIKRINGGRYDLVRHDGRTLKTFICECYAFDVAEYRESIKKLGELDVIIINSSWCGYSDEVKLMCRANKSGLFDIGDFMAALHHEEFWMYLNEDDRKKFEKNGWL